jgi:hypothetical protein
MDQEAGVINRSPDNCGNNTLTINCVRNPKGYQKVAGGRIPIHRERPPEQNAQGLHPERVPEEFLSKVVYGKTLGGDLVSVQL